MIVFLILFFTGFSGYLLYKWRNIFAIEYEWMQYSGDRCCFISLILEWLMFSAFITVIVGMAGKLLSMVL